MNKRLRALLDSPAANHTRALWIAVLATAVIAAVAIFVFGDKVPEPPSERTAPAAAPKPTLASAPTPTATVDDVPAQDALDAAKRDARKFIRAYLDYSYGHRGAQTLPVAGDELKAKLASEPVRVPPRVRRREPRILAITTDGASEQVAQFNATIQDGRPDPYSLRVELARTADGWQAVAIG